MKAAQSRYLVIDASVARAAGGEGAIHPTSTNTRNFLSAVLAICHRAVMTPAVQEEWNKHQSRFARKWRSSMVARKKLLLSEWTLREDIRNQVAAANVTEKQRDTMLKDCHLLESAISTDYRVISLDDTVRDLFRSEIKLADVQNVLWVNPDANAEDVLLWLEDGAPEKQEYKLA